MFLLLGITDSGAIAEVQKQRYSLGHKITKYHEESFTTEYVGVKAYRHISPWIEGFLGLTVGYESHYRSKYYGQSYIVAEPVIGLQTRHNYIGVAITWNPVKPFYRISSGTGAKKGLRHEPEITIALRFNLSQTVYVPKAINENYRKKDKK